MPSSWALHSADRGGYPCISGGRYEKKAESLYGIKRDASSCPICRLRTQDQKGELQQNGDTEAGGYRGTRCTRGVFEEGDSRGDRSRTNGFLVPTFLLEVRLLTTDLGPVSSTGWIRTLDRRSVDPVAVRVRLHEID